VIEHLLRLHTLRKSVWAIINDGVANNADLSIVSSGRRLQPDGYGGPYTTDVRLWTVIHVATDADPLKVSNFKVSNKTLGYQAFSPDRLYPGECEAHDRRFIHLIP
jgi:hypothetical protein